MSGETNDEYNKNDDDEDDDDDDDDDDETNLISSGLGSRQRRWSSREPHEDSPMIVPTQCWCPYDWSCRKLLRLHEPLMSHVQISALPN